MIKFNEKGQAFSTFRLLISAIVAIFILTFLLQILSIIPDPTPGGQPVEAAATEIDAGINDLKALKTTDRVVFDSEHKIIGVDLLAEKTTVGESDLCVHPGPFDVTGESPEFEEILAYKKYKYNGQQKQIKISVLCDREKTLGTTITTYHNDELDPYAAGTTTTIADDCGFTDAESNQVRCLVILRESGA